MPDYQLRIFKDDFDFHKDCLPDSLGLHFGDQFYRAQHILKNRNQSEIIYAIDLLDWMLFEGERLGIIHNEPDKNTSIQLFANRVKALKLLKSSGQIDISEPQHFPDAKWSEYFAVMTLVYIAEILHSYEYLREHGQLIMETDVPRIMEWAIESMDSVSTAEFYQYQEQCYDLNTDQASEQTNFLIKNIDFADIKKDIINRYSSNYEKSEISIHEAALHIVEELKDTRLCAGRFPYETIERWIEQYKKTS